MADIFLISYEIWVFFLIEVTPKIWLTILYVPFFILLVPSFPVVFYYFASFSLCLYNLKEQPPPESFHNEDATLLKS